MLPSLRWHVSGHSLLHLNLQRSRQRDTKPSEGKSRRMIREQLAAPDPHPRETPPASLARLGVLPYASTRDRVTKALSRFAAAFSKGPTVNTQSSPDRERVLVGTAISASFVSRIPGKSDTPCYNNKATLVPICFSPNRAMTSSSSSSSSKDSNRAQCQPRDWTLD